MENKKTKRFYTKDEIVWIVSEKKEGKVKSVNKDDLKIVVEVDGKELELPLWSVDKLKYRAKKELVTKKKGKQLPIVYFAKVRNTAIIPSKRDEDAGYDLYANLKPRYIDGQPVYELRLPVLQTTLVPTGIAMALPKTHYLNTKHERGSTGKISLSVLAGVVDSGYRGEIFVALTPLHKEILITSEVEEVEDLGDVILYPYSKAVAQATIDLVPQVHIKEISFEDLKNIKSERGDTKLGQSGK